MNGRSLIDSTSLFSAPEGAHSHATAASPPPVTNPFLTPDLGPEEDGYFPADEEPASFPEPGRSRTR
ncbi:hypothetical protein AB0E75_16455 [Streptomyces griseoviridis]|uniref:Uncharacterized protein n=1 Tax=Streptomyces griseoviridis TaxID=45398 RepID=A0A918LJY4_STRGD|nr:hypothetical protein [Streptomyces niveoruber]GGS58884.1 hypothetical protein GCM10010238_55210 [Streptomyces niveoruber]